MSHHGSWLRSASVLVSDASVWINLVATGHIELILRSSAVRHQITTTALIELESGRENGRRTAGVIADLLAQGLVDQVLLSPTDEEIFMDLIIGAPGDTLDDGEAATIATALGTSSIAMIDERKATALCKQRYPRLVVKSTTDLLLSPEVRTGMTRDRFSDCLFGALADARMRVPEHHLAEVCGALDCERRQLCPSLPARWRSATTDVATS